MEQTAAPLTSAIPAAVVIVLYQLGALGVTILTAQSLLPWECYLFILSPEKVNLRAKANSILRLQKFEIYANSGQCQYFYFHFLLLFLSG